MLQQLDKQCALLIHMGGLPVSKQKQRSGLGVGWGKEMGGE